MLLPDSAEAFESINCLREDDRWSIMDTFSLEIANRRDGRNVVHVEGDSFSITGVHHVYTFATGFAFSRSVPVFILPVPRICAGTPPRCYCDNLRKEFDLARLSRIPQISCIRFGTGVRCHETTLHLRIKKFSPDVISAGAVRTVRIPKGPTNVQGVGGSPGTLP